MSISLAELYSQAWAMAEEMSSRCRRLEEELAVLKGKTCATCCWSCRGRSPDGDEALECVQRPFQLDLSMLGRVRIWVNPDHYCAAWGARE